jgi:membrane protein DedA with SNARE-associated domain
MRAPKFKKSNLKSILFYYSIFFSTILAVGGFYTARSKSEIISSFLFLPVTILLWLNLIQRRKEKNEKTPG